MSLRHAKVPVGPDIPGYEVDFTDWKANHVGDLPAADVTVSPAVAGQTNVQDALAAVAGDSGGIRVIACPFAFNTPNLLTGAVVYPAAWSARTAGVKTSILTGIKAELLADCTQRIADLNEEAGYWSGKAITAGDVAHLYAIGTGR